MHDAHAAAAKFTKEFVDADVRPSGGLGFGDFRLSGIQ